MSKTSDSQFLKDSLDKTSEQAEEQVLVTDGAYAGKRTELRQQIKISALSLQGFPGDR